MANKFDHLTATERVGAPSTPATGDWAVYFKSDGMYHVDDAGTETGPFTAADLAGHLADASDAHDASAISVLDTAANFTGTDVEAVLAELAGGGGSVSDAAYGVGWDGDTTTAPSKNAVYDKIETLGGGGGGAGGVIQFSKPTHAVTRSANTLGSLSTPWTDSITTTTELPKIKYDVQLSAQASTNATIYVALAVGGTIVDRAVVFTAGSGANENRGALAGIFDPGAAAAHTCEVFVATNGGEALTVNSTVDTSTAVGVARDGVSSMQLQAVATA